MGNGNRPFEPTACQADDVLIQLVYADSTVDQVATSKGITVDQLTEWLARPEITALKARIEAAATSHTRYSAIVNSRRQVRLLVDSCFEIHSEIHDSAQGRRPPRSSTQILKTVDKVLQICREMQYLTGFTPGDTPPPRRMPKADRKPRTTDTAPNRGTDTALSVRGGPPATAASPSAPSVPSTAPPAPITDSHAPSHNRADPSNPKCHDGAAPSTVVQVQDSHDPTPALVQQHQQPEPHFVSPSEAAAVTPSQPPPATSPPAPTSNCPPACETGERWLPDAQRLVAAPSDSPPMKWAVEAPPAPTAPSSSEPLASPHTAHTTPAEAARHKRQADFRADYDNIYEGDEPDFDDAVAPPPRVPPPAPPTPRIDKVRHYNTVEPFS